jgi:hypothetical protein
LKSTIEYIGEWEAIYNPNFNYTEFGTIKNSAGVLLVHLNKIPIKQMQILEQVEKRKFIM